MTRLLPICLAAVLLAACTAPAFAGGVAMSWGDYCGLSTGGSENLTWACRNDTTTRIRATCSFMPDQSHTDLIGLTVDLAGMSEAATLPDWWQLGVGGCREGALTLSTDGSTMVGGAEACIDPWAGLATGLLGDWVVLGNHFETTATCTLAQPVAIEAGLKYFACQFQVGARKTTSGECTGCVYPMTLAIRSIELQFAGGGEPEVLDWPYPNDGRCLSYQSTFLWFEQCSNSIVPTRGSTWGQIKSLYR
jgi:hypothetical protein